MLRALRTAAALAFVAAVVWTLTHVLSGRTAFIHVGAMLGTVGLGLISSGRRRLSSVDLIPHETLATIREDIAWVKEKTT